MIHRTLFEFLFSFFVISDRVICPMRVRIESGWVILDRIEDLYRESARWTVTGYMIRNVLTCWSRNKTNAMIFELHWCADRCSALDRDNERRHFINGLIVCLEKIHVKKDSHTWMVSSHFVIRSWWILNYRMNLNNPCTARVKDSA